MLIRGLNNVPLDLTLPGDDVTLNTAFPLYLYKDYTMMTVYNENIPKLTADNYVYITSSATTSMLNTNGTPINTIAIVPRNRAYASSVSPESAYINNSTLIKTHLNSLRTMNLTFTDKNGDLLQTKGEYIVAITIFFNLNLPKE
jgi:hypothetical protein